MHQCFSILIYHSCTGFNKQTWSFFCYHDSDNSRTIYVRIKKSCMLIFGFYDLERSVGNFQYSTRTVFFLNVACVNGLIISKIIARN